MIIPLEWIRKYRTETRECLFTYQDGKVPCAGIHGGPDSQWMHNDLLRCYTESYEKFRYCTYKEAWKQIAHNLRKFQEKYSITDTKLDGLIEKLENPAEPLDSSKSKLCLT